MKEKFLNVMIVVVVTAGTALVTFAGSASQGAEPFQSLFMAFLAAIIVIQVIPALMLVGALIRALRQRGEKALQHNV